jgi:hypothetical protein
VDGRICGITNKEEIKEVETALQFPLEAVRAHIQTSLDLFANKQNPEYRNSIKESISAVEALCRIITKDPKATLGKALDKIEHEKKIVLPQSLKQAFDKLYGYTSSADGIRHGLTEDPDLKQDEARFFLIAFSAFVIHLKKPDIILGIPK